MVETSKPTLKAIILDFSSVNNVDITSVQHLIDVRNQLDRYASPNKVDWHMACINNRWTKRALGSAGFGYPAPEGNPNSELGSSQRWKPIFSVADIGGQDSAANAAEMAEQDQRLRRLKSLDVESQPPPPNGYKDDSTAIQQHDTTLTTSSDNNSDDLDRTLSASKAYGGGGNNGGAGGKAGGIVTSTRIAVVHGLNRPLFHIDLTSALQSAITNAERKSGGGGNVDNGDGGDGTHTKFA